jgi:hypothetical protein
MYKTKCLDQRRLSAAGWPLDWDGRLARFWNLQMESPMEILMYL